MNCEKWNDAWVASLYDELEEPERQLLTAHLEQCTMCRKELDALRTSSELLRQAVPTVPGVPRVLVLRRRAGSSTAWAFFGAGAAAATLALAGLMWTEQLVRPGGSRPETASARAGESVSLGVEAVPSESERALEELQRRVDELERTGGPTAQPAGRDESWTRAQFQQELRAFRERYEAERAADLRYVLETMAASEQLIDRNSQALTYLALRESPWVAEY